MDGSKSRLESTSWYDHTILLTPQEPLLENGEKVKNAAGYSRPYQREPFEDASP